MKNNVSEILECRDYVGSFSVNSNTTLKECAQVMKEENVGSLMVIDNGEISGILSERDLVFRAMAEGMDTSKCRAREIMTSKVITVELQTSLSDCARLMREIGCRHLPVLSKNGELLGMVSERDLVWESYELEEERQSI